MKVAITASNKEHISGKADDCVNYWIYTIENKVIVDRKYIQLGERQNLYSVFVDTMVETFVHPIFDADMLLTNDISPLITARLKEKRTVAFIIDEIDIEDVVNQLIEGVLQGYIAEEHTDNCGH